MNITILNGDINEENSDFTNKISDISEELREKVELVNLFDINKMNLKYCTGCWSCWIKTPGQCAIKDRAEEIFKSVIKSDLLIFASPLLAGFTSSALKKITDRLIVLLHPYVQFVNKECRHRKRYDKYPDIGLILDKEMDTDEEDIRIVNDIYDRFSLNFYCKRLFTLMIKETDTDKILCKNSNSKG